MEILIIGALALLFLSRGQTQTGPQGYGARDPGAMDTWQAPAVGPGSMSAPPGSAAAGVFEGSHGGGVPPLAPPSRGGWMPSTGMKSSDAPRTLRGTPPLGAAPARPPNLVETGYRFNPQPGNIVLR